MLTMATLFLGILATMPAETALPKIFRFDMGTSESPSSTGFVRITADSKYSASRGYGWESSGQSAFDVARPPENPRWRMPGDQAIPQDLMIYKEHNDLTRDGVRSREDLVFRANLPNGKYRLILTLGKLDTPICSMQVHVNDRPVARDVDAKHFVRRGAADQQYGFPRKLRLNVDVDMGYLRIRLHGDDSGFRERFAEEIRKPVPFNYLLNRPEDPALWSPETKKDISKWGKGRGGDVWVWRDIGGPFTENAVNAIEIYPAAELPLQWSRGKLTAAGRDAELAKPVSLFNEGKWAEAEKAFDAVRDPFARALGYLWLAGRPSYEEELRLVPKALALIEKLAQSRPQDHRIAEVAEHARRMDKALYRFEHRADEQRTYNELLMIAGEIGSFQPEDPCYYKAKIYAARGCFMVNPSRHTFITGVGRDLLSELEKAGFAENRFVRWYLHNDWAPREPDWTFPDYSAKKAGAPKWAAEVYEAFNRELDLAEWWFKNRQTQDGALGGGWGDDVEVLRSFGSFASASLDASPAAIIGVRKVADGAWNSGSIDTQAGYFAEVGDTEHTGEWTADTIVAMIRTDYGNPRYLERALKTGRLMRDLWMERNANGHFLMRSNFLGAAGVGPDGTLNDSRINWRPASPARAALWYNNLPALSDLFLNWADSWLAAALSTEKGKPRGIIPQEIGFARSEIGGTGAPAWHAALNRPGTVNYDWAALQYHDYIVDLLLFAFEKTGDRKYLEPMELESQFVLLHCPKAVLDAEGFKGDAPLNPGLWQPYPPGSNEWLAIKMVRWPRQWEETRRILFPAASSEKKAALTSLEAAAAQAAEEASLARARWPHVTTECIATDRVYWPGLGNAVKLMTAQGAYGSEALVTYRGLGREFAAVVLNADAVDLRVALFNISAAQKDAAVVPWLLRVGHEYLLRAGPDADGDGRMDRAAVEQKVRLRNRGQELSFPLPGRTPYLVEIGKISEGGGQAAAADLALSDDDVRFLAEYERVDVTVHNIGSAAARRVAVVLMEAGKEIGRQVIPNLEAPLALDPQTVRIGFSFVPAADRHRFTVVIDPEGAQEEITRLNNRVEVELATPKSPRRRHSGA